MISLSRIGPQVDGELRLDPQQIAPLHRPIIRELVTLQQAINQGAALVRIPVHQELRGLLCCGQRADDVEIGASDEHCVGAQIGRLNVQLPQAGENQLVYLALWSQVGAAFKNGNERSFCACTGQGRCQHKRGNRRNQGCPHRWQPNHDKPISAHTCRLWTEMQSAEGFNPGTGGEFRLRNQRACERFRAGITPAIRGRICAARP